ncbi:MAG: hypothetical protein NT147_08055, partial [Candidatus Aminicenantes bacterium]|nr:hypothetical protein [Candidatus Aminicenantes bacterium]
MKKAACLLLAFGPLVVLLSFGQTVTAPSQSLDDRVRVFLASQKDQWREENVTEADGRFLYDLILKRGYTRAL